MPSPPFKIAILGAGPAGLTLAARLSQHLNINPPYTLTIFEQRSAPTPADRRQPTGSLDLHVESGQRALAQLGLLRGFLGGERVCSEELRICGGDGRVVYGDAGSGGRPECARGWLMDSLLSGVDVHVIRWGRKVESVELGDGVGKWAVHFSTGGAEGEEREDFDLVIGADGAHSKTRRALTEQELVYSTVNAVTLTIPSLASRYPGLARRVGTGSYWALAHGKAVMCQRGSFGSARIYLMLSHPERGFLSTAGLRALRGDAEALESRLLGDEDLFGGFGEEVGELIRVGCREEGRRMEKDNGEISIKPLWMLPVGHKWEHRKGVTMIGDAAHLMTPFAGEGVNLGMLDGLELGEAILDGLERMRDVGAMVDGGISDFEERMWSRSERVAGETWGNLERFFGDEEAPRGWVEFFGSFDLPPVLGEGGGLK